MSLTEYEKSIIEAITLTAPIKINAVMEMEDLGTYSYNEENFNGICTVLQSGEYSRLPKVEKDYSFDDITVIRFKDDKDNIYYTVIYDSWALEQYPTVLRIYPFVPTSL